MSLNSVRFACTTLVGTNKVGNIKPDADGYYPMVIGALKMYNSAGEFYDYDGAANIFKDSSPFMRRVSRGVLKGEYGHPKMQVGQKPQDFARRVLTVDEANISHHIRDVWLETEKIKGPDGKPVVAIMGNVRPSGPRAAQLQDHLNNRHENVCFSIRAFTDDRRVNGVNFRTLKTVVTFDYVLEPGMSVAEKYKNPALESFHETVITRGELERAVDPIHSLEGMAMESARLTVDELFTALNWGVQKQQAPAWRGW